MITNLFSSFDPCSSLFFYNWLRTLLIYFLIPLNVWLFKNRIFTFLNKIILILHQELKTLIGLGYQGRTLIFISLLFLITVNNFIGLFPYIFTSTSHLVITLSFAAPLWLAFIIFGWINNINHMFTHLVPLSTPNLLIPFMVIIESISNLIRPGTLTVRLSANIIAGHLLLTLLGNQTSTSSRITLYTLLSAQILLLLLEIAVALIQAYVFTVLSSLYASEVISH